MDAKTYQYMKARTERFSALTKKLESNAELLVMLEKHDDDRELSISVNGNYRVMTGTITPGLIAMLKAYGVGLQKELDEV